MKCPKCGEEIQVPYSKESKMSPWAVAAVIVVILLVAVFFSAYFMIVELKPKPKLIADLSVNYYDYWPYEPFWRVSLSGTVHNYGDTGCFATLKYTIEGASDWTANGSVNLGWMPGEGGVVLILERFEGGPMDESGILPDASTLNLNYHFNYTEP